METGFDGADGAGLVVVSAVAEFAAVDLSERDSPYRRCSRCHFSGEFLLAGGPRHQSLSDAVDSD